MPDAALVVAAAHGDRDSFAELVAPRLDRLYATATLILRDRRRAEDAVQDGLVRAWRDIPNLRDPHRFDAWLRRLLVNACYDESRRGRRHESTMSLQPDHDAPTPDAAGALEVRDALDRGLVALSVDQRAAIVMHYYLGLSLQEMANTLDIPLGTAKSRLHHARIALRAAVEQQEQPTAGGAG